MKLGAHAATAKALDVDHHHQTGRVRGVLCRDCKHGLGTAEDNPLAMTEAQFYLLNWDREVPDRAHLAIGG